MTKILSTGGLAVSAFALLAFASQPAAADGMKSDMMMDSKSINLSVGGFFTSGFAVIDDDISTDSSANTANTDDNAFSQNLEVHFKGEATLDNGTVIGARIELEGDKQDGDNNDTIDEHYVYVRSDWGKLIIGAENGAGDLGAIQAPSFVAGFYTHSDSLNDDALETAYSTALGGAVTPTLNRTAVGAKAVEDAHMSTRLENISGDALKFTYFTPRISGVQFGVSYAPNNGDLYGGNSSYANLTTEQEDIYEFSLNYKNNFDGVDFAIGGAYVEATSTQAGAADPESYNYGASVGANGFTIGGNFTTYENLGSVGDKYSARINTYATLGVPTNVGLTANADGSAVTSTSYAYDNGRFWSEEIETYNVALSYDFGNTVIGIAYTDSEETLRGGVLTTTATSTTGAAGTLSVAADAIVDSTNGSAVAAADAVTTSNVSRSGTSYTEYTIGGTTNLAKGVDLGYFYKATEADYDGNSADVALLGVNLALKF